MRRENEALDTAYVVPILHLLPEGRERLKGRRTSDVVGSSHFRTLFNRLSSHPIGHASKVTQAYSTTTVC